MVAVFAISVNNRRLRQYSRAVDASRPRVELSQHPTAPRVTIVSAIDTLFFSPPEIPWINYISRRTEAGYFIANTCVDRMFYPEDGEEDIEKGIAVLASRHLFR